MITAPDRPDRAIELLSSKKIKGDEQTVIPSTGISVGDRMYVLYGSIASFTPEWTFNYSGIAYSDDDGQTWVKHPDGALAGLLRSRRYRYWNGDSFAARDEADAVEIVSPMTGEMSVAWSPHYHKWVMLYTDGDNHNVALRTAES